MTFNCLTNDLDNPEAEHYTLYHYGKRYLTTTRPTWTITIDSVHMGGRYSCSAFNILHSKVLNSARTEEREIEVKGWPYFHLPFESSIT